MTVATTDSVPTSGDLALVHQQTTWTERQRSALAHIGVEHATEGDLEVFFHVCKRTGLDPFARQIYMIGRQSSEKVGNEWVKVTKQTIQTGIDGFRLIGRRAADRAHHSVSVEAPEWAHGDGSWRPLWSAEWGAPIAARVTIRRDGQPFTAVALFDEYKQTKRDGSLTQMWAQRPAGQIAKCAEALAWRMAFPQDLSGIYSDDEMGQADGQPQQPAQPQRGLAAALASPTEPEPVVDAELVEPPADAPPTPTLITEAQQKKLHASFNDIGIIERDDRLAYASSVVGRELASSKDLTKDEARAVIDRLISDGAGGER